jgi:RNA polymerase sigma factor (sigma-70 family)
MADIEDVRHNEVELLWVGHGPDLVRFATMLVGPTDGPDIAVEAFLRASGPANDPAVVDPRAYLFRAVLNRAHDLRRADERRWRRDLAAVGPASADAPDTFIDVRVAVSALSLAQRSVIYFIYWHDHTERQTAELLGVSLGTVRRHLVRARDQLRKALR